MFENDDINEGQKIDGAEKEKVGSLNITEICLGFLDLDEYGCA